MADDIQLTEEEQVARIKDWWKQNAISILFGVGGGLALVFGYQYWQEQKVILAENASADYQQIVENKKPTLEELAKISAKFKAEYASTPYDVKASLMAAKYFVEGNDLDSAVAELQYVTSNSDDVFTQHLARTRLANILVEQNKLDEAKSLISIADKGTFEAAYYEVEGDIARLNKDFNSAKTAYDRSLKAIGTDPYSQVLQLKMNKMNSLASTEVK